MVSTVHTDIEISETLDSRQFGVMRIGATATTGVMSLIDNGLTCAELVTIFNPMPTANQPTSVLLGSNVTGKASLY